MTATIRASFPSGTGAASSIAVTTVSQSSVTVVAGDVLYAHAMLSAGTDTGITLSATYGGAAATGSTAIIHANSQTAGGEKFFWWLAPATGTATVTVTAAGGTPDALGLKVYAVASSDGNAPTIESAGTPNDTTNRTAATSTAINMPAGSLGISGFVAGSNFSSTGTGGGATNVLLANVGGTGAAISMAGAQATGTGANVTFTATISAADWYAETVAVFAAGAGAGVPGDAASNLLTGPFDLVPPSAFLPGGRLQWQGAPIGAPPAPHADPPYFSDRIGGTSNPVFIFSAEDWGVLFNAGTADGSGNYNTAYDNYFTTRAAQGYNGVEVSMFSQTNLAGGLNGPDGDGVYPWNTNSTNPLNTANTTFWNRRDYFISSALSHGFYVFLNAGTAMLDQGSFTASWTTAQWQAYGTFLGTRYGSNSNIMWIMGDDYFGDLDSNLDAFLTNLRAAGATQPMSYQAYQEASSRRDIYNGAVISWGSNHADYNWGYSYNVPYDVVEKMTLENDTLTPIPYMWADGVFLNSSTTGITSDNLGRRMIWWALSSGSKGFNLGDNDVWQWGSGSQSEIATANLYNTQIPAICTYWRSLPGWHRLLADTSSQLVTGGRGTHATAIVSGGSGTAYTTNTDSYVTASRTPDGTLAVIYMSHASTITIDESKMVAGYTATWVDPASGATSTATPGPTYNSGSKGSNSVGDADWVLVLAQAPVTFSTTVGDASYAGGTSTFTGDATFTTTVGDAGFAGGTSTFAGDGTITTTVGDAAYAGGSSSFTGDATFTTTVGDAAYAGGSSSFTGDGGFTTVVGDSTWDGGVSTFSASGDGTFTTVVGDAAFAGGSSTFSGDGGFSSTVGDSTWAGGSSTFTGGTSGDGTITTLVGDATFTGGSSTFTGDGAFVTVVGDASFGGGTSTFTVDVTFTTLAASAAFAGGTSTSTGDATFTTTAGDAAFGGGVSTFSGTGSATFTTLAGDSTWAGGLGVFFGAALPVVPTQGARLEVSTPTRRLDVSTPTSRSETS